MKRKRDDYKHRDLLGQVIEYAAGVARFNLVEFLDDQINLRLRLPEDYSSEALEKLKPDYDKLTNRSSDYH